MNFLFFLGFYETWENLIENQSGLNADVLESRNNIDEEMGKNITGERFFSQSHRDGFYVEKRFDNQSMMGSTGNLRFSYTNLFQTLDSQKKSYDFSSESVFLQKRINEAREDRNQVKTFLSGHSDWLKDVKQKVYFLLYFS